MNNNMNTSSTLRKEPIIKIIYAVYLMVILEYIISNTIQKDHKSGRIISRGRRSGI